MSVNRLRTFVQGFEEAWEDFIFDRTSALPTLFEIDNIDARWLPLQRSLLGFTRDLSFDCTTEELRRILSSAVKFWNDKPSEEGVVNDAIRMVTGNRFRASNYFDFRMQVDQTVITEELEDFDPNVIDFPGSILTGVDLTISSTVPGEFSIADLPTDVFQGGVFFDNSAARFVIITKDLAIRTLDYVTQTGNFTVGSTLTGGTSGATAVIIGDTDAGTTGTLFLLLIGSTVFDVDGETITDAVTGSADTDGVLTAPTNIRFIQYNGQTGDFAIGSTLTGGTSSATATILDDDDQGSSGTLTVQLSTITEFEDNEAITDAATGAAVVSDPDADNLRIFKIDSVTPGTSTGKILGAFPIAHGGSTVSWRLVGFQDDFLTEVRLVDPGVGTLSYDGQTADFTVSDIVRGGSSGAQGVITADADSGAQGTLTLRSINGRFQDDEALVDDSGGTAVVKGVLQGVLNRTLLAFLMNLARANGERIDVVYINFLDRFIQPNDLDQWAITPTGGVIVPAPGSEAVFAAGARLIDADSQSAFWGDQVTAWKILSDTVTTVIELTFFVTDASNHYFVRADYSAKTIELFKKVATVDTQIGSTVSVPVMKVGVQDVVRVDAVAEGTDVRIRVKLSGDLKIDELDSPPAFTAGGIGAFAATSTFKLKLVEVNVLPTELDRIGPNP